MLSDQILSDRHDICINIWLVVLTILKNISQWEGLFPIYYGKIKNIPNHQPDMFNICIMYIYICVCVRQRTTKSPTNV
jgi:hypothetical protein